MLGGAFRGSGSIRDDDGHMRSENRAKLKLLYLIISTGAFRISQCMCSRFWFGPVLISTVSG